MASFAATAGHCPWEHPRVTLPRVSYLRLSGPLGHFARTACHIGLATALLGSGVLMVSEYPRLFVGPLEFAAIVFWMVLASFMTSIEGRLPLETRFDPPERLAREYATRRSRLWVLLVAYQMYQVVVIVVMIVSVKLCLEYVALYAVHHGWQ